MPGRTRETNGRRKNMHRYSQDEELPVPARQRLGSSA